MTLFTVLARVKNTGSDKNLVSRVQYEFIQKIWGKEDGDNDFN